MAQRRRFALLKQPFSLDSLGDVNITGASAGQLLEFDGSVWTNVDFGDLSDFAEAVDDRVAALMVAGNNIDVTYDDVSNTFTIAVEALTSADIGDFSEAVDDRVGSLLVAGNNIDLTYNDAGNTLTIDVEALTSGDISDFNEAAQDAIGAMVVTSGEGVDLVYTDATPALAANLDINGLTAEATVDPAADYFVMYDASASAHRKVLGSDLPGGGGGGDVSTDAIWDAAGDLVVGSGADTAARLAVGAEGEVLTVVSGLPAWAAATGGSGGGGGTSSTEVDAPPESPEPEDDEFDDTTLDTAKWQYGADWNNGSVLAESQNSGAYVFSIGPSGSTNEKAYAQAQSDGTYKYRAKVRISGLDSEGDALDEVTQYARVEIFVATDSDNKRASCVLERNGSAWTIGARYTTGATYNSGTTYSSAIATTTAVANGIYLEIEDDGTNLHFRASMSGHEGTFATFRTASRTAHLGGTADRVGFAAAGGTSGNDVACVFEWFRKIGSTYSPGAWGGGAAAASTAPLTPDSHPSTADAMDDEFEGATLDGKWSWFNQGSVAESFDVPGALVLSAPAETGNNLRGIVQAVSGSAWKFRAKVAVLSDTTAGVDYMGTGLVVRNSAGPYNVQFGPLYASGWRLYSDNRTDTAFGSGGVSLAAGEWYSTPYEFQYLEVELASGTIYFRHSKNGYVYKTAHSVLVSSYLGSITDIGLCTFVSNASNGIIGVWDWFRRIA